MSTNDQNVESQFCDLRSLAKVRGYEIVAEYSDTISGTKAKRPGLDHLLSDARRGRFNVVFVWVPSTGSPAQSNTSSKLWTNSTV